MFWEYFVYSLQQDSPRVDKYERRYVQSTLRNPIVRRLKLM